MESPLLPSEIARLVLGYLEEEKCDEAAQCFLEHSPHLSECLAVARQGRKFSTRVLGNSLNDILDEYCAVNSLVAEHLQKLPEDSAEQLRQCGRLIDQLRFLLDSTRSGQTVLVSITVPPQGTSPPGSNVSSIVSNRSRSWLQSSSERKRTSVRWHQDTKQRSRDRDDRGSSAGSIPPLEATPLESLPGISGGSSGLDSRSTQTGREGESQASSAAKASEETTVSSSGPEPEAASECVAERQANTSDSDQSYKAPRVPSKESDHPNPIVPSPRRKSHSTKKKPTTPLLKGQSPNRPRRSHSEDSDSSENVAKSLHRALLDNKELHEKIAENINRVIRIPNEGGAEAQVLGLQASEPLVECDGMLHELNQAIKTIVEQTEQDPLFERFLEEIIGPVEDEGSPSPAAAESDPEDASGLSETVADEDVQSKTCREGRQEEDDEQNVKSPNSEVPLKQRLRSSSKQKRDSLNTSGSSPSTKDTKKPVCTLDDQNALAIQFIVNALPHHTADGIRQPSPHRSKSSAPPHQSVDDARQPSPHRSKSSAPPHQSPGGARQPSPHRSKSSVTLQTVNSSTENTSTISSRNSSEKRTSVSVGTSSELSDGAAQAVSEESAKVDSCVSDKRTDNLGGNLEFTSSSLGKPFSVDRVAAKNPADNPPDVLISTEMPVVLPEPKSSMPVVMVTIPSSQELSLEASQHRQPLTEQDIMSMPTVIVCDPDRGMTPFFNLTQQSHCTTAEVTHVQSSDDITRYKPIAPKTTASTNTSTTVTSLPTDIVQPIVLRSVSHKQLETILTTTCTTPLIVKRDIMPRIQTAVPSKAGGPSSPSKARKVVEVQTISLSANNSKKIVDLSKPSTSKEGFGAEQYKRALKQQTCGESRKKKEDPKKDGALSGVRTRSQDKALNKQPGESPTGPDSITLYACDADGKSDKMSTLKRQDIDLPNICTDGSPLQLSKSPVAGHEGTPSEDGREKLLGALNLKHSGRKSSENPEEKGSKVVSPQLETLLNISKNNVEKDVALEKSRDTPQTLSGRSISNPKRLSLSTPRRRRSHIRALDFGTPPKSGTERSALRRSNTSPKGAACKQRSPRGNDSACKSVRRSSCYKSPLSRINQAKNIRSSLFKSPNPPCGGDAQDTAVVTSSRAECPIATRSPAPQLKGDWDKVTGAGLIFGSETPEQEPVMQLTPKTLFFSPESQPSDSETQQQLDTAVSVVADKADSNDSASVTSSSQTSTKPKSKSRAWDADLRALLTRDFDNLEVVPKPTKMKARKRCSSNSEIKVPAKKSKKPRISKATKDEARMVEAMLNSSGETEKGQDNSDISSPAKDTSDVGRAEAKGTVPESSSQKDESESTGSNFESTSNPSGKACSSVEEATPSHKPPAEEPSPDSSSACESNVAVTSSEKMFSNSAACAKVVLSPTKLNASKRTFVQKPKGCALFVSEDFEENIETFVISGDSPSDAVHDKPSNETGSTADSCAKSDVSLPPPPPKIVLLDTPRKIEAIAADLSRLIPLTPRLLSPRHQEDTPMTKFLRDQPCINLSMIQTPSFPPTPHLAVTPNSQKSDESPSSYATRMTDYSSCSSSYYNPSTYLNTPAKPLEQVLIDECNRIEMGKPSSKEKRHEVGTSAEKQVIVDTSEIEKEMERIHGPVAEMTCMEKETEPTLEGDGRSAKTTHVEGITDKGSNAELSHVERELDRIEKSKQRSTEIHKDKEHEAMTAQVENELERIHKEKDHEVETIDIEKDLEEIHKDKVHEVETIDVENDLERIHKDKVHEVETIDVEKDLEHIHKDKEHEVETVHVQKDLVHSQKDGQEDNTAHVDKDLECIQKDTDNEVDTTHVEKGLERKKQEDKTTRVEKDLEHIQKGTDHEVETTHVEKCLERKKQEDKNAHVEKDLEHIHKDKEHESKTVLVEKELEQIHKDKKHDAETMHVEKKKLEQIRKNKGHETEIKHASKELEQSRKNKGQETETKHASNDLEQSRKNKGQETETKHASKELEQSRKRKRRATKTTKVEKKLEEIHKDKAQAVETTHIVEESGRIHGNKEHEAKTTNVEKELQRISKDKEPVPEITLIERELERIHEGEVSCVERETESICQEGETLVPSSELIEPRPLDESSAKTSVCSGMETEPVEKEILETQRPDHSHLESNTGAKVSKLKISLHSEKVIVQSSDTALEQTKSGAKVMSVQKKCINDVAKRLKPNPELRTPVKSKNKIVKKAAGSSVKKQALEKEIMQKSSEELIKNCLETAHKMLFGSSKEDWDGSDSSSDSSSTSSSSDSSSDGSSSSSDSQDSSSSEDISPVAAKKKVPVIIESDSQEERATTVASSVERTEVSSGIEQQEHSGENSSLEPENSAVVVTEQSTSPMTLTVEVDLKKVGITEEVICSSWEATEDDKLQDSSAPAGGEVQNSEITSNVAKLDFNAKEISSSLKNMKPNTQWNLCADDAGSSKARVCRVSFDKTLSSELEDKKQRMLARLKEADKKMKPIKSKGNCPPKTLSSVRRKSDDVRDDDNSKRAPSSRDPLNQTSAESTVNPSLQSAKSPKKDVEAIAARLLQQKNAASSRATPSKENTTVPTEKSGGQKEKPNEAGGKDGTEMCARDKVKLIHNASCIRPPILKTCREEPTDRKAGTSKSEAPPAAAKVKKKKSSNVSPQAKSSSSKRPVELLDSATIAKQLIEDSDVSEVVRVEKFEEPSLGMSQGMFLVRYTGLGPRHPDFVVEDISDFCMDSEEAGIPSLTVSPLQELLTVAPSEKKPVSDKPKSPKKKPASPVKNICFDTRPLSVRKQEMYRSLRNRHRNGLGSPSSRSSIHRRQKTSLQHKSPLAHLYKDYISEKYTATQRRQSRFSPARHRHGRSGRDDPIVSPRRLKIQELRRRASSRTREPSSSHRTRHDTKRRLKTRRSISPSSRSKKTSEPSTKDRSSRKEGELSDTSDEKERLKRKKSVSRVRNPNSATEPEQELTDDTLMTYAIVGSYREETTGESSSVGSPYHTPGQDFDITARVPPPSVACLVNRETSDANAAASGPTTSDESRSLPPKKRKASTEDSTVQPEKRARAENPQSLLKSVDLDIFLTMVHGNELS